MSDSDALSVRTGSRDALLTVQLSCGAPEPLPVLRSEPKSDHRPFGAVGLRSTSQLRSLRLCCDLPALCSDTHLRTGRLLSQLTSTSVRRSSSTAVPHAAETR